MPLEKKGDHVNENAKVKLEMDVWWREASQAQGFHTRKWYIHTQGVWGFEKFRERGGEIWIYGWQEKFYCGKLKILHGYKGINVEIFTTVRLSWSQL